MSDDGYRPQALPDRLAQAASARGLRPVVGDLARWGSRAAGGLPWALAGSGAHGEFDFLGQRHAYLHHPHKLTWLTERAVEVPVVRALVDRTGADARVLEVGNVLSHYGPRRHVVVDKYERAPGVLNRDVLELGDDLGPFDLIVAISTLEHVGWDEPVRDPGKAVRAVHALRERLAPGGRLVLTLPVGYNPAFDAAVRNGEVQVARAGALRRVAGAGAGPRWREESVDAVWDAPYDFLLYSARGVVVAFIDAPGG